MTKEEILNMGAGRDMDALIIKEVMGWELMSAISFEPSINMSDAWQVVEKLRDEFYFSLSESKGVNSGYTASFSIEDYECKVTSIYAPIAICKAVLLTKVSK